MSQRVAFICKGCTSIDDSSHLKYLQNNVNEVSSLLKKYGKWDIKYIDLKNPSDIKNSMKMIDDEYGNGILFYYTGHGISHHDKYYLIGSSDERIDFQDVIWNNNKFFKTSVSIIIDACYSGILANIWKNQPNYEIITSTYLGHAYESDKYNMSYFSYYFSKYIKQNVFIKKEDIKLSDIHNGIGNRIHNESKNKQKTTYLAPLQNNHMTINTIIYYKNKSNIFIFIFIFFILSISIYNTQFLSYIDEINVNDIEKKAINICTKNINDIDKYRIIAKKIHQNEIKVELNPYISKNHIGIYYIDKQKCDWIK